MNNWHLTGWPEKGAIELSKHTALDIHDEVPLVGASCYRGQCPPVTDNNTLEIPKSIVHIYRCLHVWLFFFFYFTTHTVFGR